MLHFKQFLKKSSSVVLKLSVGHVYYFRAALILLSIVSALFVLEIYSRLTYVEYHLPLDCFQYDDLLNHSHTPNKICRSVTPEWNVIYSINSQGLRDKERSFEKPANIFRILMLGDSFTEGWGVAQNKTFSAVLEEKLNTLGKGRFEVINMGVGSYSPLLEYLQLKNVGLKFQPDLVILNFDYTDFVDDGNYETLANYDVNHNPVSVTGVLRGPYGEFLRNLIDANNRKVVNNNLFAAFLSEHSFIYRKWIQSQLNKLEIQQPIPVPTSANFILPERNLKLISDMLKSKNIPLVFTLYPQKSQLESGGKTGYFRCFRISENRTR